MKKLLIIAIGLMFIFQACYDDFKFDYEYTTTYFAVQNPVRTVVVEEDKELTFEIGVMLGGKYFNDEEWTVQYKIDETMLDSINALNVLPSDYYTLSDNSKFVIKEGEYMGAITVTLNEKFLADTSAAKLYYALPLKITSSTTDSILTTMDSTIVAIQFQNEYYGAYWVKGVDYTLDGSETAKDTTIYSDPDLVTNKYITFGTKTTDVSTVPHVGNNFSGDENLNMTIAPDGSVNITSGTNSAFTNVSGSGNYNKEAKTFTIDYTYFNGAEKHHAMDTLIYFDTPLQMEEW